MSIKIHNLHTIPELDDLKTQSGFDVNFIDNYKTALFNSNLAKTDWLLKHKIDVHKEDKKKRTALFYVKNPEKLCSLLSAGANPYHLDRYGRSFLYYMNKRMLSYLFSDKNTLDLKPILNKKDKALVPLLFQISLLFEIKDFHNFVNKGGNIFIKNTQKEDILSILLYEKSELIIPLLQQFKFKNIDSIHNNGCVPANLQNTGNLLLNLAEEPEKHLDIIEHLWNFHNKEFINMFEQSKTLPNYKNKKEINFINKFIIEKERVLLKSNTENMKKTQKMSRI